MAMGLSRVWGVFIGISVGLVVFFKRKNGYDDERACRISLAIA
jgi:hypothetical protein